MRVRAILLVTMLALVSCGPPERETEIARNRSLADIERACMRKAEARLAQSPVICIATDPECRPRFLAAESEYCSCSNRRIGAEFTDAELEAIATFELAEARAREASVADVEYQELISRYYSQAASVAATQEDRHRLASAAVEAGRACRVAAYQPMVE